MPRTPARIFVLLACLMGIAAAEPGDAVGDSPCSKIAALIVESTALSLPARVEHAFTLTLLAADNAAHKGEHFNAVILLRTFTFEVRAAKRAHRVRPQAADVLIARAQEAISALPAPLIVVEH